MFTSFALASFHRITSNSFRFLKSFSSTFFFPRSAKIPRPLGLLPIFTLHVD